MILLDERVPRIIQQRLPNLPIVTVDPMGWRGITNGKLLELMDGRFNILVTTDKNLRYQQNLERRQIALVILPTNQIPLILVLMPQIEDACATTLPGELKGISMPSIVG